MTILIKVGPHDILARPITIDVPKTKFEQVAINDTAYLWFSETSGGHGLAGRGRIASVERRGVSVVRVQIVDFVLTDITFGNAQLGAFRDSFELGPINSLARKIYRYALNRSVPLSSDEAVYLDQYIGR